MSPIFMLFTLLSSIGVLGWWVFVDIPPKVILLHLLWIIPVHLIASILISMVRIDLIKGLLSTGYIAFFLLFYLLIGWSVSQWGDYVTVKIISTYLLSFSLFCKSIHLSPWVVILVFLMALALIGSFIFNFKKQFFEKIATSFSVYFMLVLLLAGFLVSKRFFHKQGEPMLVFCFDHMWGLTDNPFFSTHRIAVGQADKKLFDEYTNHKQHPLKKNIVLIVCDALRADHLPMYGYGRNTSPFLNELYKNQQLKKIAYCITTSASTTCGIPSLLLSRRWKDCAVDGFNLFKLLHAEGFKTHAIIAGAHKEWYNLAKFYTDDCDFYFDGKDSKKYYFKDDRVILEGLEKATINTNQASFFYLHIQSPHASALLRDSFIFYSHSTLSDPYDNKILQADATIKAVMDFFKKKNMLDNTIFYITADHGDGLGEHGVEGHVDWLYQPQINVPLLIYGDTSFYQNQAFARQLDIAPTIVERLGLIVPSSWQGKSLLSNPPYTYSYHETGKNNLETKNQKFALVQYSDSTIFKYIFNQKAKTEELYELKSDPNELTDLAKTDSQKLRTLRTHFNDKKSEMYDWEN